MSAAAVVAWLGTGMYRLNPQTPRHFHAVSVDAVSMLVSKLAS